MNMRAAGTKINRLGLLALSWRFIQRSKQIKRGRAGGSCTKSANDLTHRARRRADVRVFNRPQLSRDPCGWTIAE